MSQRIRFYLALIASGLIALAWILTAWSAEKPGSSANASAVAATTSPAPDVAAAIDNYLAAENAGRQFMGSVLVSRDGHVLFEKGYGYANAEWKIPNAPDTKFRLGSITKQFTATLIMQLQEQGKLKVTDGICKYLDPCPPTWSLVTVHHLLSHTGGMPSYTEDPAILKAMTQPQTLDDIVGRFRGKPLDFAPGTDYHYSNSGYFLLGLIIEKITSQSYEKVLAEQIFEPLGMKDTGYDHSTPILPNRASGYRFAANRVDLENADYTDMSWPFSAGALYSTVRDLEKWNEALYTDKILPQAALAKMWTPVKQDYGYGWSMPPPSPSFNHRLIGHGGSINGFSTYIARYPDDELAVIVLSNNVMMQTEATARAVATIALGGKIVRPEERQVIPMSAADLAKFVGQYRLAPTFVISVRVEGDHLTGQATGQPPLAVFPESDVDFFARALDAQLTFQKDESGAVTGLTLHQNGHDTFGPKISGTVVDRKAVPVDAKILRRYVGDYELAAGFTLSITLESGHLMAQATGQPKVEIFAESPTEFFYKATDAQISFQVDANRETVGLVLHQRGDRPAKKIR
jgi:CubicO group peptidase (beta-lactamase class C family)